MTSENPAPWIDPGMRPVLDEMRRAPFIDYESMGMAEGRAVFEKLAQVWNTPVAGVSDVRDFQVVAPGGPRRARLFTPEHAKSGALIIHLHGGGWTYGSIESHEGTSRLLAVDSGVPVLSLDYRLAPEHPAPAAVEDALACLVAAMAGQFGARLAAKRIALAGDSAGANVALGTLVAANAQGRALPATAALFYGCFGPVFDTWSHKRYGGGEFGLSTERMRWYRANHLGKSPPDDPVAAPLSASLSGLPPLFLNAAGLDPLLEDTLLLIRRLAEAGIHATFDLVPGVTHGFMRLTRAVPAARQAVKTAGAYLAEALA